MELAYRTDEHHPVVDRFLERRWRSASGALRPAPPLDISLDDEMFRYALTEQHQHRGLALMAYLRSGLTAAETLQLALGEALAHGNSTPRLRVLDFAAGYGRVTRFLLPLLRDLDPEAQLEVAEISDGALAFQHRHLDFVGHRSTTDADNLSIDRPFDAVTCCSLFTHLPRHRWQPWLSALWRQLDAHAPSAALVFSTNGEDVLFPGRSLDPEGFCIESVSEKDDLELSEYGTTWTNADFVRRQVEAACPDCTRLVRVPRGLWHFQDLWIAVRTGDREPGGQAVDFSSSHDLPLPPEGYLDVCAPQHAGRLGLGGWAIDRAAPDHPPRIEVFLGGEQVGATQADRQRPEVAAELGEAFLRCGWQVEIELPEDRSGFDPAALLEVTATSAAGRTTVLHLSALEGADLVRRASGGLEETRSENLRLRVEIDRLEREKAAMEASRFWKLRNAWFRLTGRR